MWLARAQQIQVGTIQNVDAVHCGYPMRSIGNERPQTGRQMQLMYDNTILILYGD